MHWPRSVFFPWRIRRYLLLVRALFTTAVLVWLVLSTLTDRYRPDVPLFAVLLVGVPLAADLAVRLVSRPIRQRWRQNARPQWRPQGQINPDLDSLLRDGLLAAIMQEDRALERTVRQVEGLGLDVSRHFRELLIAVNAMALYAVSGERWPERHELKSMAEEFSLAHRRLELPVVQVRYMVSSLPKDSPTSATFFNNSTLTFGFAFLAWLLTDGDRPARMSTWTFLDEIEAALNTGDRWVAHVRFV